MSTKKVYSWKPQLFDQRDYKFVPDAAIVLPEMVDHRSLFPVIYDQKTIGSCTSNSISMCIDMQRVKEGLASDTPSRLFIYYNERVIEGTEKQDAGAMIRDGIKSVATTGYCPETLWPYIISKFKTKPKKAAYTAALQNKVKQYFAVDNTDLNALKSALAQGYNFVFGFTVYESFESDAVAKTGMVPMPKKSEKVLGGHAVCCIGYRNDINCFIVKNSWSSSWGDGGIFYMPYTYMTSKLASDFWIIQVV